LLDFLKRYDEAIICYQQTLDTPGYDTLGTAHHNLGNAYADKGEHDRAIICYQQALDTPGFDTLGAAHHNMGNAYARKGEYDRAIICFQKALDTPSYDSPGYSHHDLGSAYACKGEHDRAITCYHLALDTPGYDRPGQVHNNLALTLRAKGKLREALAEVEKALKAPDQDGEHQRARYIKSVIEAEQAGVKPTRGEEALVKAETGKGQETPEQLILQKLGRQEQGLKDKYLDYLLRDETPRDAVFSCLRGWSSAVTLLEGGDDCHWAGGGYFLKWHGKGIVIDPGFDFIDNFHDAGYNMREVDAVLVSHNHSDHNYDLSSVDDLRYELHKRWKTLKATDQRKHDVSQCLFVIDEDTAKSFRDDKADHRGTPLKFTTADCERKRWIKKENGLPVTVEHFKAEHGDDVPHAVGMRLRLHGEKGQPDFILGYTGDTRYFETLPDHLKDCDVLLAHISMPDEEEYEHPDHFKKVHLGYNGLARLLQETQPKMVLVGEFWAGLADIRIDLIKGLRGRTGNKIPILPTGLGFHLKLPSLEVECTGCKKTVPHDHIKIAPATSSFGPLGYLCPRCLG
jgi:tetratricopeptide (TPR) repeat protein/ribonuclease BN (tRNA processing enzyme)